MEEEEEKKKIINRKAKGVIEKKEVLNKKGREKTEQNFLSSALASSGRTEGRNHIHPGPPPQKINFV